MGGDAGGSAQLVAALDADLDGRVTLQDLMQVGESGRGSEVCRIGLTIRLVKCHCWVGRKLSNKRGIMGLLLPPPPRIYPPFTPPFAPQAAAPLNLASHLPHSLPPGSQCCGTPPSG